MNARIKELAEQATAFVDEFGINSTTYELERDKKFAELIVRECSKVLEIQGANTGHEQYYYGASLIDEHFGIE